MNDAGRATGYSGGEIVLLDQQRTLAGPGTFAGDRDAVDAASNHDDVEVLSFQWRSRFEG